MKKFWILLVGIVLMSGGCYLFAPNQEEKFVNLLFYKPLIPISSIARETYLTPKSLKFSNSILYKKGDTHADGWTIQKCFLQENKQDYIVLKCRFDNPVTHKTQTSINKFQISECVENIYCANYRWLVELIEYEQNNFRRSGEIYGIE